MTENIQTRLLFLSCFQSSVVVYFQNYSYSVLDRYRVVGDFNNVVMGSDLKYHKYFWTENANNILIYKVHCDHLERRAMWYFCAYLNQNKKITEIVRKSVVCSKKLQFLKRTYFVCSSMLQIYPWFRLDFPNIHGYLSRCLNVE